MNKLQKALCIGAGIFTLAGCAAKYETGTVIGEYGSVVTDRLVKSDDALLGGITANDTVKLGNPTYVLQIKTENGIYTASVIQKEYKSLDALEIVIKKGTKIKFKVEGDLDSYQLHYFGKDKIGCIYSKEMEVISEDK